MNEKKFYNKSFYKDCVPGSACRGSVARPGKEVTGEHIEQDDSEDILNISIAFCKTLYIDSCRLHD